MNDETTMFRGRNYINGVWQEHAPDFSSLNPCTEMEVGFFPITEHAQVNEAVDAAKCAFESWRKVSRIKRAEYFDKLAQLIKRDAELLTDIISIETGKNRNESYAEVMESLHMVQVVFGSARTPTGETFASELETKDAYVMRKPRGVVAVISPWNFPLAIGSFWSSAPAIAEGNCVVHKPSEYTPWIAQAAAMLYHEAGFPPGVYNLIHGMGATGRDLVEDKHVDVILFTGSAAVGQGIRQHCATTWHKTCSIECGSKSASILFADGNQDIALKGMVASAFKLSGQRCVSSSRLLVQRSVLDEFVPKLMAEIAALKTGAPMDNPAPFYGPIISRKQMETVMFYNKLTEKPGVKILLEGKRQGNLGWFLTPHVYQTEGGNERFLKEEVFGPHVAIIPFDDVDDAIRIYNDTDYGLALGVITDDFRIMRKCRDECNFGMLYLNGSSIGAESHLPFGGVGKSGNGYKSAAGTYRAVTEEVAVTTNYEHGIQFAQGMK